MEIGYSRGKIAREKGGKRIEREKGRAELRASKNNKMATTNDRAFSIYLVLCILEVLGTT